MNHPSQHKRVSEDMRLCTALDCPLRVRGEAVFCARHWAMLPESLRSELFESYVPGQHDDMDKVSTVYLDVTARCMLHIRQAEASYGRR